MSKLYSSEITDNNKIKRLLHANKLYDPATLDNSLETKFTRYGYLNPYSRCNQCYEYIFFTKPDLHLFDSDKVLNKELANDPFFRDCLQRHYNRMRVLQSSYSDTTPGPFISLLSSCVTSTLDVPGITMQESQGSANIYGTSPSYLRSSERSDENHEFSLEFCDNDDLRLYMLFKIWDEYERRKDLGLVSPPNVKYIENKILHDQISAYKIVVGDDRSTLIFYAKLWGVYPKSIPRDVFSSIAKGDGLNYSISFHADFVEDMTPLVISDFNNIVKSYKDTFNKDIPFYDEEIGAPNGEWCHVPYIAREPNTNYYQLRWR